MRCDLNNKINLDALVGRLTTFELDNYDNCVPSSRNLEATFQAKLSLKKKGGKYKGIFLKSEDEENANNDVEVIVAFLARNYPKGNGKYKGKIPLIYFSCEEVGHIVARCPNREGKEEKKNNKYKNKKEYKRYKEYKGKIISIVLWKKILIVAIMMK